MSDDTGDAVLDTATDQTDQAEVETLTTNAEGYVNPKIVKRDAARARHADLAAQLAEVDAELSADDDETLAENDGLIAATAQLGLDLQAAHANDATDNATIESIQLQLAQSQADDTLDKTKIADLHAQLDAATVDPTIPTIPTAPDVPAEPTTPVPDAPTPDAPPSTVDEVPVAPVEVTAPVGVPDAPPVGAPVDPSTPFVQPSANNADPQPVFSDLPTEAVAGKDASTAGGPETDPTPTPTTDGGAEVPVIDTNPQDTIDANNEADPLTQADGTPEPVAPTLPDPTPTPQPDGSETAPIVDTPLENVVPADVTPVNQSNSPDAPASAPDNAAQNGTVDQTPTPQPDGGNTAPVAETPLQDVVPADAPIAAQEAAPTADFTGSTPDPVVQPSTEALTAAQADPSISTDSAPAQ